MDKASSTSSRRWFWRGQCSRAICSRRSKLATNFFVDLDSRKQFVVRGLCQYQLLSCPASSVGVDPTCSTPFVVDSPIITSGWIRRLPPQPWWARAFPPRPSIPLDPFGNSPNLDREVRCFSQNAAGRVGYKTPGTNHTNLTQHRIGPAATKPNANHPQPPPPPTRPSLGPSHITPECDTRKRTWIQNHHCEPCGAPDHLGQQVFGNGDGTIACVAMSKPMPPNRGPTQVRAQARPPNSVTRCRRYGARRTGRPERATWSVAGIAPHKATCVTRPRYQRKYIQ